MSLKQRVASHLQQFPTAPFLFVGSGLSRRYIGLEDWEGILRRFSSYTDRPYEYYRATGDSNMPRVATELARRLHEIWWNDGAFEESRQQFGAQALTVESALKIEISRYLEEKSKHITEDKSLSNEISLLGNAIVDGVITTNWDLFLEQLFPEFDVYIGQDELLFSTPQSVGEIYKIHGCCTKPNSLILTAGDYNAFEERNPYLASKLLTIFVEHPVLFIGHSLTDTNIRQILQSIVICLTSENIDQLANRLIFVQWDPEVEDYEMKNSNIVIDGFNIPVITLRTVSFSPVFEALSELPRRFPAQLLRRLKEHVYELVLNNDPSGNLYVQDIDEADESVSIDVVFGVGAISQLGYRSISRADLLHDILFDNKNFDPKKIAEEVLPVQLARTVYVPVFKYLRAADMIDGSGSLRTTGLDDRVETAVQSSEEKFLPSETVRETFRQRIQNFESLTDVIENNHVQDALNLIPFLEKDRLTLEQLGDFLRSQEKDLNTPGDVNTQFGKAVCLYDYLRHKRGDC